MSGAQSIIGCGVSPSRRDASSWRSARSLAWMWFVSACRSIAILSCAIMSSTDSKPPTIKANSSSISGSFFALDLVDGHVEASGLADELLNRRGLRNLELDPALLARVGAEQARRRTRRA